MVIADAAIFSLNQSRCTPTVFACRGPPCRQHGRAPKLPPEIAHDFPKFGRNPRMFKDVYIFLMPGRKSPNGIVPKTDTTTDDVAAASLLSPPCRELQNRKRAPHRAPPSTKSFNTHRHTTTKSWSIAHSWCAYEFDSRATKSRRCAPMTGARQSGSESDIMRRIRKFSVVKRMPTMKAR